MNNNLTEETMSIARFGQFAFILAVMITKRLIFVAAGIISAAVITTAILVVVLRNGDDDLIVTTPTGSVKGTRVESEISNFEAFFSIPYAIAPVNELRFKAPIPFGSWEGIHDGTVEGPACYQRGSREYSENCLTLSVYTNDVTVQQRPVYVWIHGGALLSGHAGMDLYGPHYFLQHDIVLVVVQFRLSILGFLNMNVEEAPGNMGLADVIEALKWVQANIVSFGGDPGQVTIGGLSSGGIMAHALLLSPVAQGLFHKVIIHSGTAFSYRFYNSDITSSIQKTKEVLDLYNSTDDELLAHLKTLKPEQLLNLHYDIGSRYPTGYAAYHPYAISKDYLGILPSDPFELVQNNEYLHLPMLIGMTTDEGIRLEASIDRLDFVNDNFYMVVPTDLFPIDDMSLEKNETARLIKEFYFGDTDLSVETFPEYAKLATDSWYGHITDYLIRLQGHLKYNSPIYYYVFGVDGAYNYQKLVNGITSPGANHGDDLGYMWKIKELEDVVAFDSFSELSRDRYVAMLSNFIKSGNPTPETNALSPVIWEPVEYPTIKYLLINETILMEAEPFRERLLFWQRLYNYTEL